jgi:CarD family transcriptional regulator, regulator of rRNA transcription
MSAAGPHLRLVPPPDDDCGPVLDLAVGDIVVYASHGIGCVEARLGGDDLSALVVLGFESGLRVTLPVDRARGVLRPPSEARALEDVRRTLGSDAAPRIEPWSKRFRAMREKVAAGEATGLAEVIRDGVARERQLIAAADNRASAATGERSLYLQARKLLAAEIAFVRGIDETQADDWIVEQTGAQALG